MQPTSAVILALRRIVKRLNSGPPEQVIHRGDLADWLEKLAMEIDQVEHPVINGWPVGNYESKQTEGVTVSPDDACPYCGNDNPFSLELVSKFHMANCKECGTTYTPNLFK